MATISEVLNNPEIIEYLLSVVKKPSANKDSNETSAKIPTTSSLTVTRKRKINPNHTHVLVEWIEVDTGKMSILPIGHVTNTEPERIIEEDNYKVKFSGKANSGVFEAKVLAIGSREDCLKIQELKLKKKQSENEKCSNKSLIEKSFKSSQNKDYQDDMFKIKESFKKLKEENVKLKENNVQLQVTIDGKNDVIMELQLEAKNDKEKFDHLSKSFSKCYLLIELFLINSYKF